jgi:hypothetical protein
MQPSTQPTIHPSTQAVLDFFDHSHLPPHLQEVVQPFSELAQKIAPIPGAETTVALRKLLEAKDCAVRAVVAALKPKARPVGPNGE